MSSQGRAFAESLLIHGLLAGAMIVMIALVKPPMQTIRLDFSQQEQVEPPAPQDVPQHQIEPPPPAKQEPPVVQKPAPAPPVPPKIRPKEIAKIPPKHAAPVPVTQTTTAPAVERVPEPSTAPDTSETAVVNTSREQPSAQVAAVNSAASVSENYRHTNFSAIRNSILGKLHYPPIARRQGWSGQVEVAFVIAQDGTVRELHIQTSSGYPVLDDEVLDAIRRSAPFIAPHVTVSLSMPVSFHLD